MDKELKIRTIYGESYDKFKSIANKETTYLDYDLNVYAKYIIEYIDNLEQQCKKQKEVIDRAIRTLEIQIEIIKEQPSDNDVNDNFEIRQREMIINLLKGVENE